MNLPTPNPDLSLNPLGYRRLSPYWAKIEIVLGLSAAGVGLFLDRLIQQPHHPNLIETLGQIGLFVLGGYLAMAGHRSHIYQSLNQQTAALLHEMRQSQPNG